MTPSKRDASFSLSFSPCLGGIRGAGLATGSVHRVAVPGQFSVVLAKVRSSPLLSNPAAC